MVYPLNQHTDPGDRPYSLLPMLLLTFISIFFYIASLRRSLSSCLSSVSWVCPGASSGWHMPRTLSQEASLLDAQTTSTDSFRRGVIALLWASLGWLSSSLCHPLKKANFCCLYLRARSFSHYPQYMTRSDGVDVDRFALILSSLFITAAATPIRLLIFPFPSLVSKTSRHLRQQLVPNLGTPPFNGLAPWPQNQRCWFWFLLQTIPLRPDEVKKINIICKKQTRFWDHQSGSLPPLVKKSWTESVRNGSPVGVQHSLRTSPTYCC